MATPTRLGRALFREEIDFATSRATARCAAARTGRALARRLATRDVLALSRERERGWAAARRGAAINLRKSQLTLLGFLSHSGSAEAPAEGDRRRYSDR